jgi:glycosyltransferase involved in cell wall biosynthesis
VTRRILLVIDELERDGPPQQLSLVARRLPRDEFEVHVCSLRPHGALLEELRAAGVPVESLARRWKCDPLTLWRLEQLIERLQPDIVHTWQFVANGYGRIAALRRGRRGLIATEHHLDRWKQPHQWWLDRRLSRSTAAIVVNSPVVRDYCVSHGLPEQRIEVIRSGVEVSAECGARGEESGFSQLQADLELPPETRLFAASGPLRAEQNYMDVIWTTDIAKILYKDVHLLIFGTGPQLRRLERFAASIRIPERVHFLGDRGDFVRLAPHIGVFLVASEHEGVPHAALQAMAAGVPVVAADAPAHRELIVDGEHGLLVPVGDRAGFARAVHRLIEQPELARRLAEAGQHRVKQDYRADTMIERYAALYRRLAPKRDAVTGDPGNSKSD